MLDYFSPKNANGEVSYAGLYTCIKAVFFVFIGCLLATVLSSCAALVVAGAGAGAYSYIAGDLVREYSAEHEDAVKASVRSLDSLKFKFVQEAGDGIKTTVEGKRADDTPVIIVIERLGFKQTQVSVRTGAVGYFNLSVSEQVHEYIARELSKRVRKTASKTKQTQEQATTLANSPSKIVIQPMAKSSESGKKALSAEKTKQSVAAAEVKPKPEVRSAVYFYYQKSEQSVPLRLIEPLDKVAVYLKSNDSITLEIMGYTDSQGTTAENLHLSQQRVEAVKLYLVDKGIAGKRISAKGYGATNFFESNRTETLRRMNRRVELHFH